MYKFSLIIAFAASLLASVTHAQSGRAQPSPSDMEAAAVLGDARLPLAERVVSLSFNGMEKVLQAAIDQGFENLDEKLPDEQVQWLSRNAVPVFQSHMRPLIAAMAVAYSERFTQAELSAMIAFYETPMGLAIARKQLEANVEIEPAMQKFEEGLMTELMTKFCAQFDCGAEASKQTPAAKPNRR